MRGSRAAAARVRPTVSASLPSTNSVCTGSRATPASTAPPPNNNWVRQGAAGTPRLDLAALNKVEMLPWDVWGLGWEPGTPPPDDLTPFDEAAALTVDVDARFDKLRDRYERDEHF